MNLVGGFQTTLTTDCPDLIQEALTELKANSTFQRMVVKTWRVEYV